MTIYAFRGPGRIFGFTPDEIGANLPPRFAPWTAFKVIELQRGEKTPGLDTDACLDDIAQHGFHITDAHTRITGTVL